MKIRHIFPVFVLPLLITACGAVDSYTAENGYDSLSSSGRLWAAVLIFVGIIVVAIASASGKQITIDNSDVPASGCYIVVGIIVWLIFGTLLGVSSVGGETGDTAYAAADTFMTTVYAVPLFFVISIVSIIWLYMTIMSGGLLIGSLFAEDKQEMLGGAAIGILLSVFLGAVLFVDGLFIKAVGRPLAYFFGY